MVSYLDLFSPIKLLKPLDMWSCKIMWKTKTITYPLPQCQGFFQAVWFTTVYQMKIEFSINLVQSHPKPTPSPLPPHGGSEMSEKGFMGKKSSCKLNLSHYQYFPSLLLIFSIINTIRKEALVLIQVLCKKKKKNPEKQHLLTIFYSWKCKTKQDNINIMRIKTNLNQHWQ